VKPQTWQDPLLDALEPPRNKSASQSHSRPAHGPALEGTSVAYILYQFPQLSETFIDNEISILMSLGVSISVWSLGRPTVDLAGSASVPLDDVHYLPSRGVVLRHFLRWTGRHPLRTLANLTLAVRCRSITMLKGAWWAAWIASGVVGGRARLVHAHFAYEPACTAIPVGRLTGLPVTFTVHARDIYLRTRGLDQRVAAAARVITVCEYNAEQLTARCPSLTRDQIELIYCGVDPGTFTPRPHLPHDPPQVLSVGRLVEKKGFDDLVRALGLLQRRGRTVRCDIIGGGPLAARLQGLIDEEGLTDSVCLLGPRTPAQIAETMPTYDAFVLACRIDEDGDRDSMPVVLKEAMSCGLPVVASAVAGIPELVTDDVGVLVAPQDPVALADALDTVLRDPVAGAQMGSLGRERVVEHFNLHVETTRLAELFARLGAGRR
jgi:glycosyltransferase involved in cell wall biosynthesis